MRRCGVEREAFIALFGDLANHGSSVRFQYFSSGHQLCSEPILLCRTVESSVHQALLFQGIRYFKWFGRLWHRLKSVYLRLREKKTPFTSGQVHKSPMQLHLLTSNTAGCSATTCVVNPAITSTAANGVARNCITPVAPLSRLAFSRSKGKAPASRG